jgi:hypothetical protein
MPLTEWTPPREWMTVLAVDGMYFHAAREALKRAGATTKAIEKAEMRVAGHQAKLDRLNQQLEERRLTESAHYEKLEPLAIQMEGRNLSTRMRQRVHEFSVGAPPRSLGAWVG